MGHDQPAVPGAQAEPAHTQARTARRVIPATDYFDDDSDSRTRRIFAQEFVTQLARLGAGTSEQLYTRDGIAFFSARPADAKAIDYIGAWAERYGWASKEDDVWSVTDAGASVPPPPSLAFEQVLTRILRIANPVRTNATDWLPLLALIVGAIAGTAAVGDFDTLDAVRALALAVLVSSLAIQLHGEYWITIAFKRWRPTYPTATLTVQRKGQPPKRMTVENNYYQCRRLWVAALFDLALIVSIGLLIYWYAFPVSFDLGALHVKPWLFTVGIMAVPLAVFGGTLQCHWRKRRRRYVLAEHLDTSTIGFWYRRSRDHVPKP